MDLVRVGSWVREHPLAVDAALAAPPALLLGAAAQQLAGLSWTGLVTAAMVGALALRRAAPVLCTALVVALALGHFLAGVPVLLGDVAVLVALYSVTVHGPAWARRLALAAGVAGAALQGLGLLSGRLASGLPLGEAVAASAPVPVELAALVLLVWLAGQWRRTRLAYVESQRDRARRLEVQRRQEAALAVAAERARIARDVHDVVTHSLSVMIAQADGGRYAAAASPAAAVAALETVAATGRTALADMQGLLGVLRQEPGTALAPQPGVHAVPDLVDAVRRTGLAVELETTGQARALPAAAGLAVYRVVQEALTNVLKHAGPGARARVHLRWAPAALHVCVEDDGRGADGGTAAGGGRGLLGMHERVAVFDGAVSAGPRAGGGFAVSAVVPLDPAAPTDPAPRAPSTAATGGRG